MSSIGSKVDELEEGEIEEDAFEDISECSLSEALVMQADLEHDSDVDLLREEALKSLHENEEVTEEELYRLEALKSLLTNIESSEKISTAEAIKKKKRKRKKKSKQKKPTEFESNKFLKTVNDCEQPNVLVEASEEHTSTGQVNSSLSTMDFSDKENQIDCDMNVVTRSWYPKTDFALLNLCASEISNETKQQSRKHWGNDDYIIVPRILSVANNHSKSTINESVTIEKPVRSSLKLNRVEIPLTRASVPISRMNCSVPPVHLSRYKKVSKHHIQKYPVIQPTNRYSLRNVRKEKYKIVNKTCYSLKKSSNPSPTKTKKQNTQSKSVYSLNRVQNKPTLSEHSQFIIELDEDESGKEDNVGVISGKEQNLGSLPLEVIQTDDLPCNEIPDSSISCGAAENNFVDEGVAEMSSLLVKKESNIDSSKISLVETRNEISVDLKNDDVMPLLQVEVSASLTTSFYDTYSTENIEHISPSMYSENVNSFDETQSSEMIADVVEGCPIISSGACSDERSLFDQPETEIPKRISDEKNNVTFLCIDTKENNSLNEIEVPRITSNVEECDVNFPPYSNSVIGSEQSIGKPGLLNVAPCSADEYDPHIIVKEEPFDPESHEDFNMESNSECDGANVTETDDSENLLADAEADLIEIRARLLLNLGELEENMKKDESEREKLNSMLKKLLILKSSIFKFEDKIRAHQSKLSIHSDTMQALFKDIAVRTDTCAQMKNVCCRVGMEIKGPQYKPPDLYENVIEEKIKTIDFSKFVPNFENQM